MRIGEAIISGPQLTLGTIYNATTNTLAGLTQVSITNLLVSNMFIAGTALGGIALVKKAYFLNNLKAQFLEYFELLNRVIRF